MLEDPPNPTPPDRKWERLEYQTDMKLVLESGVIFEGYTEDVSLGGVLLELKGASPEEFLLGQVGELQVMPAQEGLRFPCRVVRVTDNAIGVAFDDRQAAFGMFVSHDMLLQLLTGINNSFAGSISLDNALDMSVQNIKKYLQSEAASLFLVEENGVDLVCRSCSGPVDITGLTLRTDEGIVGKAIREGVAIIIHDVSEDPDFAMKVDQQTGFKTQSILVAPLIINNTTIGALEVLNKRAGNLFEGHDRVVMTALASATAMAIQNAKMAQELLQAKQDDATRQYKSMIENAGDAIYIHDRYGKIYEVNQVACDQLGYTHDELLTVSVAQLDTAIDFDELQNTWDFGEVDPANYPMTLETAHRRKDGTIFPVEVRVSLLPSKDLRFVAVVRDITERKKFDRALAESEGRFRDFTETASDWVWEMDTDMKFTFISERFFELANVERNRIIGKTRWDYVGPDVIALAPEAWQKHREDLKNHRSFRNFYYPVEVGPGDTRHISLNGNPIFDTEGNFQGYRGTGSDREHCRRVRAVRSGRPPAFM